MSWRDLAQDVDRIGVATFDYGGVLFQKRAANADSGAPAPIPADFDGAYVDLGSAETVQGASTKPVATVHFADFPVGVVPEAKDRLILPADGGPAAGTWAIVDVQINGDHTGALLILNKV